VQYEENGDLWTTINRAQTLVNSLSAVRQHVFLQHMQPHSRQTILIFFRLSIFNRPYKRSRYWYSVSSVCLSVTLCIVAKRCILEQKLLLRAYRKSYMRNRLIPKWMTLTFV